MKFEWLCVLIDIILLLLLEIQIQSQFTFLPGDHQMAGMADYMQCMCSVCDIMDDVRRERHQPNPFGHMKRL